MPVTARGRIPAATLRDYALSDCMTVKEVADELRVSRVTIYEKLKAGVLTHIRIGGRIAIPRAAFIAYKEANMTIGSIA